MEGGRSASKILTGTPTEKSHLGRPERRLEDNGRIDLKEIGKCNLFDSAQDRNYWIALFNATLNLLVPLNNNLSNYK